LLQFLKIHLIHSSWGFDLVTENQYQQLIGELEALRKNPFEQFVFEYFDFLAWAKSKQNGKKFREQLAA
jgi:hypothetical protein